MISKIEWPLMAAVTMLVACGGSAPQSGPGPTSAQPAEMIYFGGDIVTVNDAQPTAEAVAVKARFATTASEARIRPTLPGHGFRAHPS